MIDRIRGAAAAQKFVRKLIGRRTNEAYAAGISQAEPAACAQRVFKRLARDQGKVLSGLCESLWEACPITLANAVKQVMHK